MNRTLRFGLVLALGAFVGCGGGGGGGGGGDGGGSSSWLVGTAGTLLSSSAGAYLVRTGHTTADLNSIVCVDYVHGWVVGGGGTIIRSSDGGASWSSADSGTQAALRGVAFADVNIGLAVGDNGTIVRSEDGGASWKAVSSGTTQTLRAVAITRDHSLALAVGDSGSILRSTDGGKSFTGGGSYDAPTTNWRAVKLTTEGKVGYLAGEAGELRVTSTGGASWTDLARAPAGLRGLSVTGDGSRVVAVGVSGLIWRSNDQGLTWSEVPSGTANTLNAVGFAEFNNAQGWAVGDHGTILATLDGAVKFTAEASPVTADLSSVEDF